MKVPKLHVTPLRFALLAMVLLSVAPRSAGAVSPILWNVLGRVRDG